MKLKKLAQDILGGYLNETTQTNKNIKTIQFDELYHGTTRDRFDSIVKNGFSIDKEGEKSGYGSVLGVSLTSNREIAKEHAEWAVEKFGGEEYIITINSKSLKILSGGDFARIDNNYNKAFILYENGLIDGVELCDTKTGDGCEEFEVFVFNIDKLNQLL
jgi:hypothetical protein